MSMIKGPALFLAQFAGDAAPFNGLGPIVNWAAGLGYKGVQIPSWDSRLFDLAKAAESDAYCDEVKGICSDAGVEITELSSHLQASWSRCIPPSTRASTRSRHRRFEKIPRRARPGRSSR